MKTITLENGKEVKISDESYKALADSITKIDYSEFIGRLNSTLAIKGNKYLKSFDDKDIHYNDEKKGYYNGAVNYEECMMSDLNYGNVVCLNTDPDSTKSLRDFAVFIGYTNAYNFPYIFEQLRQNYNIESIDTSFFDNQKVHIFLRE